MTFPGPVHVAFEPNINTRGDGWMDIEYVPHPDPTRQQFGATPDVAVLDLSAGNRSPSMLIIDAKYVGRAFVEQDAARMHDKYARMRLRGTTLVENVLVAHPHIGLARQWAGYGHFALAPGNDSNRVPLPRIRHATEVARPTPPQPAAPPIQQMVPAGTGGIQVLADQYWMRMALKGRRIDLAGLKDIVAPDQEVERFVLVMPRIGQLEAFAHAAEKTGWTVQWINSIEREPQIAEFVDLVRLQLPNPVIVVSGDANLLRLLPPTIEIFHDLNRVPGL